jgi:UDP-glucose 4-epimerase
VLAKFTMQMLAGEQPTIFGDGEQSRDFTFIQNVVGANLLAAQAPANQVAGRVFNVAAASRITLNETVKILHQLTGYRGEVRYAPERAGDIKHSLADIDLARKHLGYEVQVDFPEGLRRTVEWYKSTLKPGLLARS